MLCNTRWDKLFLNNWLHIILPCESCSAQGRPACLWVFTLGEFTDPHCLRSWQLELLSPGYRLQISIKSVKFLHTACHLSWDKALMLASSRKSHFLKRVQKQCHSWPVFLLSSFQWLNVRKVFISLKKQEWKITDLCVILWLHQSEADMKRKNLHSNHIFLMSSYFQSQFNNWSTVFQGIEHVPGPSIE